MATDKTLRQAIEGQKAAEAVLARANNEVKEILERVKGKLNARHFKLLTGLYNDHTPIGKLAFSMHMSKEQARNLKDSAFRALKRLGV